MFWISVLLYAMGGAVALIFIKWQKICNLFTNLLCAAGAAAGAAASIAVIIAGGRGALSAPVRFETGIPLLNFSAGLDMLSAYFLLALSALVLCVSVYSIGYMSHYFGKRNTGLFNFLYSMFVLSMVLVLTANDAVFFLVAWELMAVVSYFLVVFESEKAEVRRAGILYAIMTHVGTAFLTAAILMVYASTGSLDIGAAAAGGVPAALKDIAFVFMLIGFGTKAGVVPLHIWLPHAHPAAPSNVSALMSGVMIHTAVYGIIRFAAGWLGGGPVWWGAVILALGILTAVTGVAYAFVETNMKRLLAYSSIENIGIIFIGLGVSFTAFALGIKTIGALALLAALLHTLNHTLFKGLLFMGAGSVHYSAHTKNIEEMGGLGKTMPVTAAMMLGGSLAAAAMIPFNGFVGEWLTYHALFAGIDPGRAWFNVMVVAATAALAFAGALAAGAFVKMYGVAFLGRARTDHAMTAHEVPGVMNAAAGLLAVMCLGIGLFPMLAVRATGAVVAAVTGTQIAGSMRGGLMTVFYPLKLSGGAFSPLAIAAALAAIALLALLIVRLAGGRYLERRYGTWDCGFEKLTARMQFSSTAFSKPLKIVLRFLFRPTRSLKTEGSHIYHPEKMEYTVKDEPVFEKYLYEPAARALQNLSRRAKISVQTGSTHRYLLYIFVTILVLMLYNRLTQGGG